MPALGQRSRQNLEGVHPALQFLVWRLCKEYDVTVISGVRTDEEQQALYAQGRTKPGKIVTHLDGVTKRSNHQTKDDGWGHAVDVAPYPVDWNAIGRFEEMVQRAKRIADELGIKIVCGADWGMKDYPHIELVST